MGAQAALSRQDAEGFLAFAEHSCDVVWWFGQFSYPRSVIWSLFEGCSKASALPLSIVLLTGSSAADIRRDGGVLVRGEVRSGRVVHGAERCPCRGPDFTS